MVTLARGATRQDQGLLHAGRRASPAERSRASVLRNEAGVRPVLPLVSGQ